MTAITVLNKSNVPTGPFTRAQIAEKMATGEFALTDLAFVEGLSQWTPLGEVLAKVDGATPPAPPPITPPAYQAASVPATAPPTYSFAATMQPPAHLVYAGFWLRAAAYMIDGLILFIPLMIIFAIFGGIVAGVAAATGSLPHSADTTDGNQAINAAMGVGIALGELVLWGAVMLISWLYFARLESGPKQATYGKRLLGLRVTNLAGQRIGFGQASGRFFGKIVSGMTLYIGFIMAGFTDRKQALHDLIAGTLVVKE